MNEEINLKENALEWFQNHALDLLGPCELNVNEDEELDRTSFSINLSGTPPFILEDDGFKPCSKKIHENINLYLDTIPDGFIEVLVYLRIEISSEKYASACVLSNYVNMQSNAAYTQIFDQGDKLIVRVKVASSASLGGASDDFYYLFLSALTQTYHFFELFNILGEVDKNPDEIINIFDQRFSEIDVEDARQDEKINETEAEGFGNKDIDKDVRIKIEEFIAEFKGVLDGFDDADYWTDNLDYSIDSFVFFDALIDQLWPDNGPMEKNLGSVTAVFGSYVAITLMHQFNGEWSATKDGVWTFVIDDSDKFRGKAAQPFVWMRNRFNNKELISKKYESIFSLPNLINHKKTIIDINDLNHLFRENANGPGVDSKAVPTVFCNVINKDVILIKKGSIRNALINNLYFLLSEDEIKSKNGNNNRITVMCYWYNWKPKTTWMNILVEGGDYERVDNFSGEVVVNFGRHE